MENLSIFLMCVGILYPITLLPIYTYKGDKDFKVTNDIKGYWVISMFMLICGAIIKPSFGVYFMLTCPALVILSEYFTGELDWKTYITYILDSNHIVINNLLNSK